MKPPPPLAMSTHYCRFSIRRWIEGCEAVVCGAFLLACVSVSVSADGSKGVKRTPCRAAVLALAGFSIRRWIEGCEAIYPANRVVVDYVSVSADGSKGVKRRPNFCSCYRPIWFQYPQMDRRV